MIRALAQVCADHAGSCALFGAAMTGMQEASHSAAVLVFVFLGGSGSPSPPPRGSLGLAALPAVMDCHPPATGD